MSSVDRTFFLIKLFFVSVIIWGFAHWKSNQVPNRIQETASLQNEPIQTPTTEKVFTTTVNKQSYQIEPVHDYEIWGLVVADHDSSSWYDITHEVWNDFINTKDVCVIWGTNTSDFLLKELNYSHGNWTCYVQTRNGEAWQKFNMEKLSNNHLIPGTASVKKAIAAAHIGDVIRIKGHLVNYSINGGPQRKTSVVRNDRENGACEIIYVKEFDTLIRHNQFWTQLSRLSKLFAIFCLIAILILQVKLHLVYSEER